MAKREARVELSGSGHVLPPGAQLIGPADSGEQIQVTVLMRHRSRPAAFPPVERTGAQALAERRHLSHERFAARHGTHPRDLKRIRRFAEDHSLEITEERSDRRSVVLSGPIGAFNEAFGVQLRRYRHEAVEFRGHEGPVSLPSSLAPAVEGIFGLDDRPLARPHFRRYEPGGGRFRPEIAEQSFTALQVAGLYGFPAADGSGQSIGILELGGGYRPADLNVYFAGLNLPTPTVVDVGVDGGTNQPTGSPNGPDGEVALDIEVAGAIAPSAKIVVYFAPNTDRGFLDALSSAVHDQTNHPTVVSISWGGPESTWTSMALDAFNSVCRDAAAVGVSVCVASGDGGSSDGLNDGLPHVDFPASSPYVLGCGGTMLIGSSGKIAEERTWNDLAAGGGASGGGVSDHFPLPKWQRAAGVPTAPNSSAGRGVPDVAGDAAPATGYQIVVDGSKGTVGGTSAVAPLWAGLIARLNQLIGRPVGYLNPLLYSKLPQDPLRDITQGNNGHYNAEQGWDPCTGLGSPNGASIEALVSSSSA